MATKKPPQMPAGATSYPVRQCITRYVAGQLRTYWREGDAVVTVDEAKVARVLGQHALLGVRAVSKNTMGAVCVRVYNIRETEA